MQIRHLYRQLFIMALTYLPAYAQDKQPVLFTGRVQQHKNYTALYWPGSSASIRFTGTALNVRIKDEHGKNVYYVVIDSLPPFTLRPESALKTYFITDNLSAGEHIATLYRQTDWFNGYTHFYGFGFAQDSKQSLQKPPQRQMVFYGNSITVGAGIHERDSLRNGPSTNNYISYGALTARHFNAGYTCIASSGIGLMISWGSLIMPDIYDLVNPADSSGKYDFSKERPDIVVINLFQNDAALVYQITHSQFARRFGQTPPSNDVIIEAYYRFLKALRQHYPEAHLICTLGSMSAVKPGSPWPGYIKAAAAKMHDPKVYTHTFTYINGDGHPNAAEHRDMANSLIDFIEENIAWNNNP